MANISEAEIRKIVESIINGAASAPKASWTSTEYNGRKLIGIYADMNEAIEAADKGYRAVRANHGPKILPFFKRSATIPVR